MAATSVSNNDQIKTHRHERLLTEAQLYLTSGKDDETADVEGPEEQSPETSETIQSCSDLSRIPSSITEKKSSSRSYRFARLERALLSAKILKTYDDRIRFENDYLIAIQEDKFDRFADNYYKKIHDHYEHIKQEEELKRTRRFTFLDLEQKFLALYPTRDIKIIYIDEPNSSTITKIPTPRSESANQKSVSSALIDNEAVEAFYANCSRRLLSNPSRAEKEVASFARRAARSLNERLPRMLTMPNRLKIIDERDKSDKPTEQRLLEMNHKRTMSSITKRRHLVIKMMAQTKKNQIKMEKQWKPIQIGVDNPTCYREILERANQIEEVYREQTMARPQTAIVSRKIPRQHISLSASADMRTTNTDTKFSSASCLTPFYDSLTLSQVENTKNARVIIPTRPLTAPTKTKWVNYC